MMPNCLQYPVAMFGTLRAGCTVVNVNPLYTSRELEHQLNDSGAEAIVILKNFGPCCSRCARTHQARRRDLARRMLGVKGVIVNLVVRKVKKMVPAYELPGRVSFKHALAEGTGQGAEDSGPGAGGHRLAPVHRGHHGVSKGAILVHRNVIAALLQYRAWLGPAIGTERLVVITALHSITSFR